MRSVLLSSLVFLCVAAYSFFPAPAHARTDVENETRIGNLFDLYVTETFTILTDEEIVRKVMVHAGNVGKAFPGGPREYRVKIINESTPLVLGFPGYLYISTGLLDLLGSEDEIASVLALKMASNARKTGYKHFLSEFSKRKGATVTQTIFTLGFFFGGSLAGPALSGAATTFSTVTSMFGTMLPMTTMASAGFEAAKEHKVPVRSALLNRMGIWLQGRGTPRAGPRFDAEAEAASIAAFFTEVYVGYGDEEELRIIEDTIPAIRKAGYDPVGLVTVYRKLLALRERYLSARYVTSLILAKPGLEKKIEHAEEIITYKR